jgi:hypothetical protein
MYRNEGQHAQPPETQEQFLRPLAVHLQHIPSGGGALVPALVHVVEEALERWERESD